MYYRDKIKDISNTKGSEHFPVVVYCLNVPSSTPEKEKKFQQQTEPVLLWLYILEEAILARPSFCQANSTFQYKY